MLVHTCRNTHSNSKKAKEAQKRTKNPGTNDGAHEVGLAEAHKSLTRGIRRPVGKIKIKLNLFNETKSN